MMAHRTTCRTGSYIVAALLGLLSMSNALVAVPIELVELDSFTWTQRNIIKNYMASSNTIGKSNSLVIADTDKRGIVRTYVALSRPGTGKLVVSKENMAQDTREAAFIAYQALIDVLAQKYNCHHHNTTDIHLFYGASHVEMPSVGVAISVSIASTLTQRSINQHYAMTGVIDREGNVCAIGRVQAKILAAKKQGITHVIIPESNLKNLKNCPELLAGMNIIPVHHISEVLEYVLLPETTTAAPTTLLPTVPTTLLLCA